MKAPYTLKKIKPRLLFSAFLLICVLTLLLSTMQHRQSRDENMYVTNGALLARGSLPYLDHPYLQTPNLGFIYGAIFCVTDHLLLGARLFSFFCALLSLALVFYLTYEYFSGHSLKLRVCAACTATGMVLYNPIVLFTVGRAWNHDPSLLFALLSLALLCRNLEKNEGKSGLLTISGGFLLGLAVGTRLTYLFLLPPFLITLLLTLRPAKKAFAGITQYLTGHFAALLPTIFLFLANPDRFLFYNYGYHKLNTLYYKQSGRIGVSLFQYKLDYLLKFFSKKPSAPALLLIFSIFAFLLFKNRKRLAGINIVPLKTTAVIFPFLLAAALWPAPLWTQYFYPVILFGTLGIMQAFSCLLQLRLYPRLSRGLLGGLLLLTAVSGALTVARLKNPFLLENWTPLTVHARGRALKKSSPRARVLTLSPLYPLEGGLDIYRDLAAAPFLWRSADLLDENTKTGKLPLVTENNLAGYLKEPPRAIFIGREKKLAKKLEKYAAERSYSLLPLGEDSFLWLAPPPGTERPAASAGELSIPGQGKAS